MLSLIDAKISKNSAQFSDWVRIGTKQGKAELELDQKHSAQFSDWVRIGTFLVIGCGFGFGNSAQFSDWVRIGTGSRFWQ